MHSKLFDTYLPEFMWQRKFGGPVAFGHILQNNTLCKLCAFRCVLSLVNICFHKVSQPAGEDRERTLEDTCG